MECVMQGSNEGFQNVLDGAGRFHGHLCEGLVLGVRMAIAGLAELGIRDPRGQEGKNLVIFVETDRCPVDGIIAVTGRTPGKRSIKMLDYGKNAATFADTRFGKAVRVSVRGDYAERLSEITPPRIPGQDAKQARLTALKNMVQDDLLRIQPVTIRIHPWDLPGKCVHEVICEMCGEIVKDNRQVMLNDKVVCRPCSQGRAYYATGHNLSPELRMNLEGFIEQKSTEEGPKHPF